MTNLIIVLRMEYKMPVENDQDTNALKEKVGTLIVERMVTGDKLPTEREMVNMFGVSRTTLREALSVYEANGIITSQQGSGRYVQVPNFGSQIIDTWSIMLEAKPSMLLDLLEIRRILEIHSLPQAMQGINMEQLRLLKVQVTKMKELAEQKKTFAQHDKQFHCILFSSTKNVLLEQLLTAFWDLYQAAKVETYHDQLTTLALQHEEILNAFTKSDIDLVTKLMNEQFADARYRIVVALMEIENENCQA
jgi:DNA-binding FadR family transcriptional regulator